MYKIVAAFSALIAISSAGLAPVAVGISGVSHVQRVQSHVPIGYKTVGVPVLTKGLVATPVVGLGHGLVGGHHGHHGLVGSHVVGHHSVVGHQVVGLGKGLVATPIVGVGKGVGLVGHGYGGVGLVGTGLGGVGIIG